MSLGSWVTLGYVAVAWPLILVSVRLRFINVNLFCLTAALVFTVTSLFWILTAAIAFDGGRWGAGVWDCCWASLNLVLAQTLWDIWNNRRKRRKCGETGRVGLRLGRLVIVPEN